MDRTPLVSICIPVHNRARYIERCLESILADGHAPREIVVVDDGSTDGSADVVARWAARHPGESVILHGGPHRGIPATFNRLVDLSRGEMIAWLGSDDLLLPGGIAARTAYLAAHPEKMAVFADARVIDGADRPLFDSVYGGYRSVDKRRFRTDGGLRRALTTRWCVPQPVLLVRRKIYDQIGRYDESLLFEDYDFYLRMLAKNLLGYADACVSAYRVHDENHSGDPRTRLPVMRQFFGIARKRRRLFTLSDQVPLLAFAAAVSVKGVALGPLAWFNGDDARR